MRIVTVAAVVLIPVIGCEDRQQAPPVVIFTGEMEVNWLQPGDPNSTTDIDTVNFSVEGVGYRLDHITNSSGLCSSGGSVADFGSNSIVLTPVFTIPTNGCDSTRIPRGVFKAAFDGDSLRLGPDTIIFDHNGWLESVVFTFRLTR